MMESVSNAATAESAGTVESLGYKQELKRSLKLWHLIVYGVVFMSPLAPVTVFGMVSKQSFGMIGLVYIWGVFVMAFTALSYARLGREFPIAGSVYSYVQRAINPHFGWVAGWAIMADYILAPGLLFLLVGTWLHSIYAGVPVWLFVVCIVIVVTAVNLFGVKWTATATWVLLGVQCIVFLWFVAAAWVNITQTGGPGFSLDPIWQPGKVNLEFLAAATSLAVLGFLGFDGISTLAEEVENPEKNIGRGTLLALVFVGLIFLIQVYFAQLVFTNPEGVDADTAFFTVAASVGGEWLRNVVVWTVSLGSFAAALAAQAAVSRLLFGMARDKMIPSALGIVHDRFKTPLVATLFVAGLSLVVALAVPLSTVIKLVNFGALSAFIILNLAVAWYFLVVKGKRTGVGDWFNYALLPAIGAIVTGYVWFGFDNTTKLFGLSWIAVGIIYGAIISKGYKEVPEVFKKVKI